MDQLITNLRAAGEPTRMRLLAILSRAELTVSELCGLLGQSQPRVSRHLKILGDAGLLERSQEGAWVFYRVTDRGDAGRLVRNLVGLIPDDDPEARRDLERLDAIKQEHASAAESYFQQTAEEWDRIQSLYLTDSGVEKAMLDAVGDEPVSDLLDIGTGTGRMLTVFADRARRALGVDSSRDMLAVARANLEASGLAHCHVRLGDIYQLPLADASTDVVTISHLLHFLDDPSGAIAEAARTLRPGGRMIVVDFARHDIEQLRTEFAHRRLGFTDREVRSWCHAAGLERVAIEHFPGSDSADPPRPPVTLWIAHAPGQSSSSRDQAAA